MSNYSKATNFASKDTLSSGNPSKIVKGTEIDNEFNAIASAITSKADSSQVATDIAAITGRVVQIVTNKYTNSTQTTGSTYIDTFNTVTITPTSTSSTIILFAGTMAAFWNYGGAAKVRMIRNTSSNIIVGDQWLWASNGFTGAPYQTYTSMNLHAVDAPATTSAVTYKIQLAAYSPGPAGTAMYGAYDVDGTIFTAIEVL
jgi:hypothetical protein